MWLKKDDRFPNHRKIRRLNDGAYRLHDTAMCFAAHDETDGTLTIEDVEEMAHGPRLKKYIPALVAANLWEPLEDGWIIHDFLDYNLSHIQQESRRENARIRQAKARERRLGIVADNDGSNGDVTA